MMRNHGPIVVGPTIAAAFDRLYYLEETCHRQMLAMSTRQPLRSVPAPVAQELADMVPVFDAYAEKHLSAVKRVLDREEPEYASLDP
jgi:ribulose-5-phosphate 4-epimerase/fuculose-1-phosphate aldolase